MKITNILGIYSSARVHLTLRRIAATSLLRFGNGQERTQALLPFLKDSGEPASVILEGP